MKENEVLSVKLTFEDESDEISHEIQNLSIAPLGEGLGADLGTDILSWEWDSDDTSRRTGYVKVDLAGTYAVEGQYKVSFQINDQNSGVADKEFNLLVKNKNRQPSFDQNAAYWSNNGFSITGHTGLDFGGNKYKQTFNVSSKVLDDDLEALSFNTLDNITITSISVKDIEGNDADAPWIYVEDNLLTVGSSEDDGKQIPDDAESRKVTVNFSDGSGGETSQEFTVNINTPPTYIVAGYVWQTSLGEENQFYEDTEYTIALQFEDPENQNVQVREIRWYLNTIVPMDLGKLILIIC